MCGIALFCYTDESKSKIEEWMKNCEFELRKRGQEDLFQIHSIKIFDLNLSFLGSVLAMRKTTKQPIVNENGILLFNGEIFDSPFEIKEDENDVQVLSRELQKCSDHSEIEKLLKSIKGPQSFIYFSFGLNTLFFGKSFFGQRVREKSIFSSF